MTPDYVFRRRVVRACIRKDRGDLGVRQPADREVPLSPDEIFHGAQHGLIRVPPLEIAKGFSSNRSTP